MVCLPFWYLVGAVLHGAYTAWILIGTFSQPGSSFSFNAPDTSPFERSLMLAGAFVAYAGGTLLWPLSSLLSVLAFLSSKARPSE